MTMEFTLKTWEMLSKGGRLIAGEVHDGAWSVCPRFEPVQVLVFHARP